MHALTVANGQHELKGSICRTVIVHGNRRDEGECALKVLDRLLKSTLQAFGRYIVAASADPLLDAAFGKRGARNADENQMNVVPGFNGLAEKVALGADRVRENRFRDERYSRREQFFAREVGGRCRFWIRNS